jgi:hypothetical protein
VTAGISCTPVRDSEIDTAIAAVANQGLACYLSSKILSGLGMTLHCFRPPNSLDRVFVKLRAGLSMALHAVFPIGSHSPQGIFTGPSPRKGKVTKKDV